MTKEVSDTVRYILLISILICWNSCIKENHSKYEEMNAVYFLICEEIEEPPLVRGYNSKQEAHRMALKLCLGYSDKITIVSVNDDTSWYLIK